MIGVRTALAAAALTVGLAAPAASDALYTQCMDASDGTNTAWAECGGAWVKRADMALNEAWTALLAGIDDKDLREALVSEQSAWVTYRDSSCEFWATGAYGREGQVLDFPACRATVIETRTRDLAKYQ